MQSTGHGCVLQLCVWTTSSSGHAPPFDAGELISKLRVCSPPPQDNEQGAQSRHTPMQSTGHCKSSLHGSTSTAPAVDEQGAPPFASELFTTNTRCRVPPGAHMWLHSPTSQYPLQLTSSGGGAQAAVLQSRVSTMSAFGHAPPCCASVNTTYAWVWFPPPQGTEQVDHSSHSPVQSIGHWM